jgi:hypothetical protein
MPGVRKVPLSDIHRGGIRLLAPCRRVVVLGLLDSRGNRHIGTCRAGYQGIKSLGFLDLVN